MAAHEKSVADPTTDDSPPFTEGDKWHQHQQQQQQEWNHAAAIAGSAPTRQPNSNNNNDIHEDDPSHFSPPAFPIPTMIMGNSMPLAGPMRMGGTMFLSEYPPTTTAVTQGMPHATMMMHHAPRQTAAATAAQEQQQEPLKRGLGRPKKNQTTMPKRPRARPRKNSSPREATQVLFDPVEYPNACENPNRGQRPSQRQQPAGAAALATNGQAESPPAGNTDVPAEEGKNAEHGEYQGENSPTKAATKQGETSATKRPRGRPRKDAPAFVPPPKRPRGRPPKNPPTNTEGTNHQQFGDSRIDNTDPATRLSTPKGARARHDSVGVELEASPMAKRPRGRPKKHQSTASSSPPAAAVAAAMPWTHAGAPAVPGFVPPMEPFFGMPHAGLMAAQMPPFAVAPTGFISIQEHQRILAQATANVHRKVPTNDHDTSTDAINKHRVELEKQLDRLRAAEAKLQIELEEADKNNKRLERERDQAKKQVATLEAKLQKQQEKFKMERERNKEAQKEIQNWKRSQNFNKASKIILPEDAEREDIELTKHDLKWKEKYEMMLNFKQEFGHTRCSKDMPGINEKYPGLATWVCSQRTAFTWLKSGKHTNLTPHRIHMLKKINFEFQPNGQDYVGFEQRIPQLQAFKDEFGHCNVQQHYKGTPGLGNWVLGMRRKYREKQLSQERIDILDAMGFQWRLRAVKVPGGRNTKPSYASPHHHHNNDHHHNEEPIPYNHHHHEAPWNRYSTI